MEKIKHILVNIQSGAYGVDYTKKEIVMSTKMDQILFIFVFGIFMIRYEIQTIMWPEDWTKWDFVYLRAFLFAYLFIKYALSRQKKWTYLEIFLGIMVAFAFLMSFQMTYDGGVMDVALFILCAKDIPYRMVLKEYVLIKVPMIILTIIGSRLGVFENLIYHQGNRVREAFGFVYPTDFAAQIFFLFLVWVLLRRMKISYVELAVMAFAGVLLKVLCDTNCSAACIWLLVCSMVVFKIFDKLSVKGRAVEIVEKIYRMGCLCVPFVLSAMMILLSRFYDSGNNFLSVINRLLNNRLSIGLEGFERYDTTLWGQYVEMVGNGGSTKRKLDYFFLDCSYVNIWLRWGLVVFALVLLVVVILMFKNWKDHLMLWILVMVCLHSVIEHHFFEFWYNVFLILPLASFSENENRQNNIVKED